MSGFAPMRASGVRNLVDRGYREGAASQWMRETYENSDEAGALEVHFGVEWEAVEACGVYRRTIADDGAGMSPGQLRTFFNTFGGGGKPIGGEHENFGIGSKTSLLPWNSYGLVVISYTPDFPDGAMIWLMQDPQSGEYGLKEFEVEDDDGRASLDTVVQPSLDERHGVDWSRVKPDFIGDHGTVLVLMGAHPDQDTILGDPSHEEESDLRAVAKFLNRRYWDTTELRVYAHEFRSTDRSRWPQSRSEAYSPATDGDDRRVNVRQIHGARFYIRGESPSLRKRGRVAAEGEVDIGGGASVQWILWDGDRPHVHDYAPKLGFTAALYRGELYDISSHPSRFRQFGISEKDVRQRLWLVVRPPEYDSEERRGVYPRGDRSMLAVAGTPDGALPWDDWGLAFLEQLPDSIRNALREASSGESAAIDDPMWRKRLQNRFGDLWRILKRKASVEGDMTTDPTDSGSTSGPRHERCLPRRPRAITDGGGGGPRGDPTIGACDGTTRARESKVAGGLPRAEWRAGPDFDGEAWAIASWNARVSNHPEGVVYLNLDHPVVVQMREHWVGKYPDAVADQVVEAVKEVIAELAVARVAHSQQMKSLMTPQNVEEELRSDGALTMSLLGMVDVWAMLADRLPARVGRKSSAA